MNIEYARLCACLREYHDVIPLSITITILALIKVWNDHDQNLSCMVSIHNHTHISPKKTAGEKTNMFERFLSRLVTFVFTRYDSPWVAMDYLFVFTCSLLLVFFSAYYIWWWWVELVAHFPTECDLHQGVPAMCFAHLYIKNQCLCIRPKVFDRNKCLCSHGCGNLLFMQTHYI